MPSEGPGSSGSDTSRLHLKGYRFRCHDGGPGEGARHSLRMCSAEQSVPMLSKEVKFYAGKMPQTHAADGGDLGESQQVLQCNVMFIHPLPATKMMT